MPKKMKGLCFFHFETGTEGGYWAFQDERFISKELPPYGVWGNQTVWDKANPERKGKTQKSVEVFRNGVWLPFPDPILDDPDYKKSSMFQSEERGNRQADKRLMKKYGFTIKYAADRMNEDYGVGNWHIDDEDGLVAVIDKVDPLMPKIIRAANTDFPVKVGARILYGGTPETIPERPYGIRKGDLTRVTVEWEDGVIEVRTSYSLLVTSWSYKGLHILESGDYLTIYDPKSNEVVWSGEIDLIHYETFLAEAFGFWIHSDQRGMKREDWAKFFFKEYPAELIKKETPE